jgi:ketosteroid isomerase-like protein
VIPGADERVIQRGEIVEALGALIEAMGPAVMIIETRYLWRDGETTYEYGYYQYRSTVEGEAVSSDGRYLVVWRCEDDGWRIATDLGLHED